MKKLAVLLAALTVLTMTGCGPDAVPQNSEDTPAVTVPAPEQTTAPEETSKPAAGHIVANAAESLTESIVAANAESLEPDAEFCLAQTAFALALAQKTVGESSDNAMISPYSAVMALAMAANGASGETLAQMEKVLGGGIPLETLNKYMLAWRSAQPDTGASTLKTANSIWFRDSELFGLLPDFLQVNADYYGAAAYRAPFDNSTVKEINQWVNDKTDGMIPAIMDKLSPEQMSVLVNAVAFDAKWRETYKDEDLREETFTAANGEETRLKMMHSEESLYLKGAGADGFLKPYDGGKYLFAAILPPQGTTPQEWLNGLAADELCTMLNNAEHAKVKATMPPFKYDSSFSLNEALQAMGIRQAFTDSADFSAMSDISLKIDSVLQKTHIDVNPEGTRAAAATAITVGVTAVAPKIENIKTVKLDRPFVYMILDSDTMLPVFIGAVQNV